jgi:hypothetical protein
MPALLRFLLVLPLLAAAAGCKPHDPIRTYIVPKETAKGSDVPPEGPDKYRLLGAVIPAEPGYWWFVKFVGPIEVVTPVEADFQAFVKAIVPNEKKPTWTAPAGWTEGPAKPTRLVTYQNGKAEMYLSGPFGGSLLDNVNRWRNDDLGLRKLTEAELPGETKEVKLGDKTAYTVDLRSPSWRGAAGMPKPPFAPK